MDTLADTYRRVPELTDKIITLEPDRFALFDETGTITTKAKIAFGSEDADFILDSAATDSPRPATSTRRKQPVAKKAPATHDRCSDSLSCKTNLNPGKMPFATQGASARQGVGSSTKSREPAGSSMTCRPARMWKKSLRSAKRRRAILSMIAKIALGTFERCLSPSFPARGGAQFRVWIAKRRRYSEAALNARVIVRAFGGVCFLATNLSRIF
jgi:hypothetical protein